MPPPCVVVVLNHASMEKVDGFVFVPAMAQPVRPSNATASLPAMAPGCFAVTPPVAMPSKPLPEPSTSWLAFTSSKRQYPDGSDWRTALRYAAAGLDPP